MTVTAIKMADGTEVDASDAVCEGCGSTLADHSCGGSGSGGSVTYSRSGAGTKRKPAASKPRCPHCAGVMHFNMGQSAINGECINRQYAVDTGEITDPVEQKPGILTAERWIEIGNWLMGLSDPITYGNMVSAAGGSGTYSGGRVKTGRKKKAVAAAPGSRIEDMAEGEVIEGETPAAKPKKGRKSKGLKVSKLTVSEDGTAEIEAVDLEDAVAEATNGHDEAVVEAPAADEEPVVVAAESDEAARAERAARRAARKAEQAAKLAKI
jgi:hypothetical protein